MATATGLTKARMLEIEAASVVDGEVVGDNLILTTHGGDFIDAGDVRGPAGPGGGNEVEQIFGTASNDWDVTFPDHNKTVNVYTEDSFGNQRNGTISFPDDDTVRIHFYYAQTGFARVWD